MPVHDHAPGPAPASSAQDDLALLQAAAEAAGDIALKHWGRDPQVWEKDAGQGPVTEADLAVDAMLRDRLLAARPGYGWLSEETADTPDRLASDAVFVIDPIDGTRAFIAGDRGFAHALAVVRGGIVTAAVVHLPAMDLTYVATAGDGALCNGAPISVATPVAGRDPRVLAARPQLFADLWPGGVPQVQRHFRTSLAWRLCLVAEGAFDATLTLRRAWHWDIAAASLIAQEAGAAVTDIKGRALVFNTPDPQSAGVVVAPQPLHDALVARLRPVAD